MNFLQVDNLSLIFPKTTAGHPSTSQ